MMLQSDETYAVIALDEDDFRPHRRHELSLSLALVFLLSARLRFYFPMRNDVSRDVDLVFDRVLKEFPMRSKGIAYEKDLCFDQKICLLESAKLVITSDLQIHRKIGAESTPNIFLDFKSGRPPQIEWRFLENLEDEILRQQIIAYSKLINKVSRLFHEGGRLGIEKLPIHPGAAFREEGPEAVTVSVSHSRF